MPPRGSLRGDYVLLTESIFVGYEFYDFHSWCI